MGRSEISIMTEVVCRRMGPALQGASEMDAEAIRKIPMGETVMVKIKRPRNLQFHKKYMSLLRFGFDEFEPKIDPEFEAKYGVTPEKNFDRFRKDVAILAGFYEAEVNIKGECKFEAKSIAFGSMDEAEFSELYKTTLTVLWKRIFQFKEGYTEAELERVANELLGFE